MESLHSTFEAIPSRIFVGGFDDQTNEAELYQAFQVRNCAQEITFNIIMF